MTPEQERLAAALAIERIHGDGAPLFIAERLGAMALAGDAENLERWREIAVQLDRLRRPPGDSPRM